MSSLTLLLPVYTFKPAAASSRSATLTATTSGGTVKLSLTGRGSRK